MTNVTAIQNPTKTDPPVNFYTEMPNMTMREAIERLNELLEGMVFVSYENKVITGDGREPRQELSVCWWLQSEENQHKIDDPKHPAFVHRCTDVRWDQLIIKVRCELGQNAKMLTPKQNLVF